MNIEQVTGMLIVVFIGIAVIYSYAKRFYFYHRKQSFRDNNWEWQ